MFQLHFHFEKLIRLHLDLIYFIKTLYNINSCN